MTPKSTGCNQLENCKLSFISWKWGLTSLAGAVLLLAGLAYAGGSKLEALTDTNIHCSEGINRLERRVNALENLDLKIDTLLAELRDFTGGSR